ncbi:MAG: OmpA family protein [Gammaproteobacteria bacterium]|nr:OmpA family protein [Gammaproteobacteria bacterium]
MPTVLASNNRIYMSPMEKSQWILISNSPIRCEIEHQIPRFGKAIFYQESGRSLKFKVLSDHAFKKNLPISFRSVTANWKGIQSESEMGQFRTTGGNAPLLSIEDNTARHAYFELQQGYQPSLFFVDEEDGAKPVSVVLSTVRFRDVEADFGQCLTKLHPDHFDDIKSAKVHFEFDDEFPLEHEEERALGKILDYLKVDPSIKKLTISGHADYKGSECYNETLSARRAWYVYDYLVQSGVDSKMLSVEFYGESRPLDKARNDQARATNRRVSVTMVK